MDWALAITTTDGTEHHYFGQGAAGWSEAAAVRDGWQAQKVSNPSAWYALTGPQGNQVRIAAGDITNVKLIGKPA